jgi:hypothetical protein
MRPIPKHPLPFDAATRKMIAEIPLVITSSVPRLIRNFDNTRKEKIKGKGAKRTRPTK